VRALDEHGGFSETGVFSFVTVSNQPPSAFRIKTPSDNIEISVYPVIFNWKESVDPDGDPVLYDIWLSTDISFSEKRVISNLTATSYSLNSGLTDSVYYWKVFAYDGIHPAVESNNTESFIFKESLWGESLNEVRIYPNPANPLENPVVFDKLPRNGRLLIYTLGGELILEAKIESPVYAWEGLNLRGKLISSGIYLAVIKDENNNAEIRKIAIIKR